MKKIIVISLVLVAVLGLIYFVYSKYVKIDSGSSVVNNGSTNEQSIREYLIKEGMTNEEVNELSEAAQFLNSQEVVNQEV